MPALNNANNQIGRDYNTLGSHNRANRAFVALNDFHVDYGTVLMLFALKRKIKTKLNIPN